MRARSKRACFTSRACGGLAAVHYTSCSSRHVIPHRRGCHVSWSSLILAVRPSERSYFDFGCVMMGKWLFGAILPVDEIDPQARVHVCTRSVVLRDIISKFLFVAEMRPNGEELVISRRTTAAVVPYQPRLRSRLIFRVSLQLGGGIYACPCLSHRVW